MELEKVTKELFLEILEVLDEKLEENRLELTLNIYGGTVMMACFDARPATKDIDALFEASWPLRVQQRGLTPPKNEE